MKLLTSYIIRKLEKHPFHSQDGKGENAEVIVKFFGGAAATWLVTEGEEQENGDWLFYGVATLDGATWEWGYFAMSELKEIWFTPFGLPIERDMYLSPRTKVCELM